MSSSESRAETIFFAAIEHASPEERARYVEQACAGDEALRRQVERLLRAQPKVGDFLASPAVADLTSVADVIAREVAALREGPGTVIGPYRLLQEIGGGGMGVVYMAEQVSPVRRKVALKIIKPGMDTGHVIARFEAERQALTMMEHPNIAKVLDAGTTDAGRPYFVMELVKGIPITDYCDQARLTTHQRLELFIQVCQAVQHAHQKGIIHRDLKPTNVLVTLHDDKPVPKVIDFGIAKAAGQQLTERTLFTNYAQMLGTPLYMSPEQAQISGVDVDTRSDVYSLGVLLYELLTGTTPFDIKRLREAAYDEMRRIIREEDPPKPSTRIGTMGENLTAVSAQRLTDPKKLGQVMRGELDWIVMKALEKERARRYETAIGLARDVERYLNDETVQACPPSARYRLRKLVRRHRTAVVTASTIALALLLTVIVLAVSNVRITSERNQKASALRDREVALSERADALLAARASEGEAKDQAFRALWNEARARRFSRQIGQRLNSLAALKAAADIQYEEGLRDEAIAAMAQPDIRTGPTWMRDHNSAPVFDLHYRHAAEWDADGGITISSLPDNREMRRIVGGRNIEAPVFSDDGAFLAQIGDSRTLRVWRVSDGQSVLPDDLPECTAVGFSPDGRQLVAAHELSVVRIDLASGRVSNRWRVPGKAHRMVFHPDNRRLAVGYADLEITSVYDVTDGTLLDELPVGPIREQVVAWHPDGERLAVSGSNPNIQIWDLAAVRKLATLEGHVQQVTVLSFHPDGELLVSGSWDGVLRFWNAGSGRQVMQWPMLARVRFSSDGRWLGAGVRDGGEMQLLEVVTHPEYRTLVSSLGANEGDYYEGDISPDGRLLALAMADGVRLWDLARGREVAFLPTRRTWNVQFESDGRGLFTCGPSGLRHWPIQSAARDLNDLTVGPPKRLELPFDPVRVSLAPDTRQLAVVSESRGAAQLLNLDRDTAAGELLDHPQGTFVALSPDGRWIATGAFHSTTVRLWAAQDGKLIHQWINTGPSAVFFTPDSRTLIVACGELSFWDIDTMQVTHRVKRDASLLAGHVAFSSDGLLMAMEITPGVIDIKEVSTTRTVARLEDPNGDRTNWLGFSPDGTQLITAAQYAKAVHIWDLRIIRTQLKAMGLDWDWPEFPPAPESPPHRSPSNQPNIPRPFDHRPQMTIQVINDESQN